jgi:peptidoglycan-associated lipoprotein
MRIRLLDGKLAGAVAALLLVAACATGPEDSASTTGSGAAASSTSPSVSSQSAGTQSSAGPAAGSVEDFVLNVGDRVFFAFDKYNLTPEARRTLERQSAWLKQYPAATVTIEGHCDERGTREYNLALGERRANSVKSYLVALGIDANRISTISYGKERPVALGSNESAWAQNRRGVTTIN